MKPNRLSHKKRKRFPVRIRDPILEEGLPRKIPEDKGEELKVFSHVFPQKIFSEK